MRLLATMLALLIAFAAASAPLLASAPMLASTAGAGDHVHVSADAATGDHHASAHGGSSMDCCDGPSARGASCGLDLLAIEAHGATLPTPSRLEVFAVSAPHPDGLDPSAVPGPPRAV